MTAPTIKVSYFPFPGRGEPVKLALAVGGIPFEDNMLPPPAWGAMKAKVAPLQLPLMEVDGKQVSQSIAMFRYACKLAKVDGKPLYPEDPLEALLVDELTDQVSEVFAPLPATFAITDQKEKEAARAALVKQGGASEKWAAFLDGKLAGSKSGFALFDRLTMVDLMIFLNFAPFRNGFFDGIPKDCFDHLAHVSKHKEKIANIQQVKDYYKDNQNPMYAVLKA
ncbi:Glutathione S-transferase 4 [Diplonema papillatum]|nr:Glutathione S-transferase 4 [Diplonema papillatum]